MINLPHSATIRLQKYTDNRDFMNVYENIMSALMEGDNNFIVETSNLNAEELKDLVVSLEELGYEVDAYYGSNEICISWG